MSKIIVVGTLAFDTIETPFGKVERVIGGSAPFASLAAKTKNVDCAIVSIVGSDFPKSYLQLLVSKEIDIVVSPEDVTLSSLLAAARTSDIVSVNRIANYDGECMEIIAHGNDKTSKIVGKRISQLKLPSSIVVGAIVRKDSVLLANHDLEIESDDHVIIFIFDRKEIPKIEKMFQVSVGFF